MTSWLNRSTNPQKKTERVFSVYYEPTSDDYAESTLSFLYGFAYSQRSAESYYIHDTNRQFQPLLKVSPILHYLKETPSSGTNLAKDPERMAATINALSLSSLRRTIQSVYQFNGQTEQKLDAFLSNYALGKKTFDVGIVLDISGCVPQVISALQYLQKRTGKKVLNIFVSTNSMDLLKEFVFGGDKSWSFVSLLRTDMSKDPDYPLYKTLAEIRILQGIEYIVVRFSSSLGKLLYLTSKVIQMESQILSVDGSKWKAME
jgi:hypothetical protein